MTTELMTTEQQALNTVRPEFTRTSLVIPEGMEFDEWMKLTENCLAMQECSMWWIGDAILYGEERYGEAMAQVADTTGYRIKTIQLAVTVAKKYPPSQRNPDLSWSHHLAGLTLTQTERELLLPAAVAEQWSVRDLKSQIKATRLLARSIDDATVNGTTEEIQRRKELYADWVLLTATLRNFKMRDEGLFDDAIEDFINRGEFVFQKALRGEADQSRGMGNIASTRDNSDWLGDG